MHPIAFFCEATKKDYGLNDDLPLVLAVFSDLQHALAMLASLIMPPILLASALNLYAATSSYMVSASLIGCGTYFLRIFLLRLLRF